MATNPKGLGRDHDRCCAPIMSPHMTEADALRAAELLKAVADPTRVRIVNLLGTADGPVCVCDITDVVGLSQATVSFHLKKLLLAGLLERHQRGTWAYYGLDREALGELSGVFEVEGGAR